MLFDNPTIREIERKLKGVADSPTFYLKMCNRKENALRKTDFLNSFLIEHPEYYKGGGDLFHKGYTKDIRDGVKRIQNAWNYLESIEKPLKDSLNYIDILNIGRHVDPLNSYYRDVRVSLGFKNYVPPNPIKVPMMVEGLLKELKNEDFHVIERAAFVHSRIAAIQPFIDGNKRTARLIQNRLLCEGGYPFSTIPLGEREYYLDLLEESMCAYRDGDIKHMGPFFNYVAAKVNVALDELLLVDSEK